jgi:uncharacterized protein (TIGR00251 family)
MSGDELGLRERLAREREILLALKVTPRASRSEVTGFGEDGSLRVRIAAVAEKGKANEELRSLLSRYFDLPRSKVQIVSGETSSHKRVRIKA